MEVPTNEELWRVQLSTGEIRSMSLDALDRAFNDGLIDARAAVLPPGASSWTTLGEAAGLDEEHEPQPHDMPSLSPVALPASGSIAPPPSSLQAVAGLDLDVPETFDELRPRRRGLAVAAVGTVAAAGVLLAVVGARLGSSMPAAADVRAAAAVQAPPPAAETLPSKSETPEEKKPEAGEKPELSDWQKRMLLDADKAREEKARAKNAERADKPAKAPAARARSKKSTGGLLEGGDRFDPLNGAL